MRIKLIILFSLLLLGQLCWGQEKNEPEKTVYLDAIQLQNIYEQWNTDKYKETAVFPKMDSIFQKYGINLEELSKYNLNPFLSDSLLPQQDRETQSIGKSWQPDDSSKVNFSDKISLKDVTSATSQSINWQAYAINGVSDFLAERFSQETMNFGMNKAVKLLEKDSLVKHCFPGAMDYIKQLQENNGGYYAADIKLLKEIVKSDFENLPQSIIESDSIITNPRQKEIFHIGYDIIDYTERGYNIQDVIKNISENSIYYKNEDLKKALSFLQLLSVALKNEENATEIWYYPTLNINSQNSSEKITANYFYGILFELAKRDIISLSYNDKATFVQNIQNISKFVKSLNKANKIAKDKDNKFTSFEEYSAYTLQIADAFQSFFTDIQHVPYRQFLSDYNFNKIHPDEYLKLLSAFNDGDYQKAASTLFFLFYGKDEMQKFRNLNFVAELAAMEKPEDMKTVIDAYALPLGSSSIKRNSSFNVSLNGYVGLTSGFETAYGSVENQTKGNIGLSAPIGISTTYKGNWTLFLSILDLGSMVNIRLNNDTDFYSDLKFEHFLMPGAGLFYNIKKTPFSLGLHYGYIPNLRSIEYSDGTAAIQEHNVSVSRFNFSFLVDIPFFTLFDR